MGNRFHRKSTMDAIAGINVTSLIDLGFSLLIVFMITAPLLEQEQTIPLKLPIEIPSAQEQTKDSTQAVSIDAKGHYFWGKDMVDKQQLEKHLSVLAQKRDLPVIHLRAHATLPYQKVIDVIDLLKKYNLSKISLDTQAAS